jgi:hypothetical protein
VSNLTKYAIPALLASAMSAIAIGLATPAVAAPSRSGDTGNTTFDSLGYTVSSDKPGTIDAVQRG